MHTKQNEEEKIYIHTTNKMYEAFGSRKEEKKLHMLLDTSCMCLSISWSGVNPGNFIHYRILFLKKERARTYKK